MEARRPYASCSSYGPLVLGACQRILRDEHAAEDAFQATFLVLVQKAASLRDCKLLANWLYGVALRVARKERAESRPPARRRAQAAHARPGWQDEDREGTELRSVLDEEIRQCRSVIGCP